MDPIEELRKRIQAQEDLEAIKRLKSEYAAACDDKYNPDKMDDLFTEDAIWDGGKYFGRFAGKKAIHDFFAGISGDIVFALHYCLMPNITVSDDIAEGNWYLWMVCTTNDNKASWVAGKYYDKYQKIDGRWLFKEVLFTPLFFTNYEDGWHKNPFSGLESA